MYHYRKHALSAFLFLNSLILFTLSGAMPALAASPRKTIDLSGTWSYSLPGVTDSIAAATGAKKSGILSLPGTLDTNNAGIPVPPSDVTTQLSRRHKYTGKAVYSRTIDIPDFGKEKVITLEMERTRPTSVKVDGIDAGFRNSISAPQRYDLTEFLTPGSHTLEITVDNGDAIPQAVRDNSHACTESTQTNWNGIIGDFRLVVADAMRLGNILVTPDIESRSFKVSGSFVNPGKGNAEITAASGSHTASASVSAGSPDEFSIILPVPDAKLWSEWDPSLCEITVTLKDGSGKTRDEVDIETGMRKFSTSGTNFTINGDTTFLRGRHDACVWPLSAHVPMDIESWRKYFKTIKEYGINHVRFHSWCPPEACFKAADEAGVYLQPELTIWGELDKDRQPLLDFLNEDMEAILREYSHHPSFTMFAIGNELWGDTAIMKEYIDKARATVPGLLATYGSNIYLGWNGHIPGEDYLVTCRVGGGEGFSTHARASFSFADADNGGIMNSTYPNTSMTFEGALSHSPVPVIGHETGQYQIYPDYDEIEKYTGVLRPDNLSTFRKRAEEAGTLRKAKDYFNASGELASRLYKADMEMNLRTPGMGGFQLLDIQDYPGQGTALVGILDSFMDSKGLMTPEEWRQACSDVAVLAKLPARTFTAGDWAEIPIILANYSNRDMDGTVIEWSLPFASGTTVAKGGKGVMEAGKISTTIPYLKTPQKVTLQLSADNGKTTNSYDIWIYPKEKKRVKNVAATTSIDEAIALLEKGKRVILCPDSAEVAEAVLGPLFQTDYWNYRMFRTICDNVNKKPSPGTLGLLIDNTHPVFENYPTDNHTDWQWFPVVSNSYPLIIDRLPETIDPIVEPIDNVERNYRLALMLEAWVGKGRLLIIMADMEKAAEHPEGEWLLQAAKEYVASKNFKPDLSLTPRQLRDLLTKPSAARRIGELNNISY